MFKKLLKYFIKAIRNPRRALIIVAQRYFHWMPDQPYLKFIWYLEMGKTLDLNNPKTFNEKLQWLKLYDRNPAYTERVDKYAVRKYVEEKIGPQYLIPMIGVYDRFNEIDFSTLPDQFVLKCTHDSNSVVMCIDKNKFNIRAAKSKLNKALKRNFYYYFREWVYKDVKPRIICEKYMVDEQQSELKDYKIFCFHGEPKFIQVHINRSSQHKMNFYDTDWNYIEVSTQYPTDPDIIIERPQNLDEMLDVARTFSEDCIHVRVDLYSINDKIYFGEMTFYHAAGYGKFTPADFAQVMGDYINLNNI